MVACHPGWGCEKIISRHFEELGLGEFINPIKADYSAAMACLLYTSPSPRDGLLSRMPSSA